MLASNDQPVLEGKGSISSAAVKSIAEDRYHTFDGRRRSLEATQADDDDLREIEALEKDLKRKGGKS